VTPEGYVLRHPAHDELPAAQLVLDAAESADCGEPRRHDQDLAVFGRDPRFDLERNVWVVVAPAGDIVGVAWLWEGETIETTADHYVHPDHRGRGLGGALLDAVEQRAAELAAAGPATRAGLVVWCQATDGARRAAFDERGFVKVRESFEMRIDMHEPPEPPVWPAGIVVRPLRVGRDERPVFEADQEAFAEHYLFEPATFAEFHLRAFERPYSDPGLWLLAWDGEQVAGYVMAVIRDDGALVDGIAVRRPWRRRGLGLALLQAELRLVWDRGQTVLRLFVDAQNTTGAVGLYEKAGLRVVRRFDCLRKDLRAAAS
jgi:mycothiol synthase